jgi:DNA-binding NtrC family response regulator
MRRLMVKHAGHSAEAARELGISRMELSRRLRKLGMGKLPAEERARAAKRFRLTG